MTNQGATARVAPIWAIQYLRAIAAIWVVVFHQFRGHGPLFAMGSHGVDIFFVISGFIMVIMTDARAVTPGRFLLDRATRILPLYYVATLTAYLIVAVGLHFHGAIASPLFLLKSLLFIPTHNAAMPGIYPMVYLGWTLNFEMFFYALFAVTLLAPPHRRIMVLSLVFLAFVILGYGVSHGAPVWQTYTNPIILEFLAGAMLGRLFGATLQRRAWRETITWLAALVILSSIWGYWDDRLGFAPIAIAVVGMALIIERLCWVPHSRWLILLGNASFSIYLFQQFGFEAVTLAYGQASRVLPVLAHHGGLAHLLSVIAAIALGILVHLFVEGPLTRAVRRWLMPAHRTSSVIKAEAGR
ncbi:acyltransferase family protein [Sphingomonas sp. Xoc002]|uniref:acyltransferase family protein n=1 Tax=Sphingomonas sp. Xoc002 TaxID=2837624 RepID=UPI003D16B32C